MVRRGMRVGAGFTPCNRKMLSHNGITQGLPRVIGKCFHIMVLHRVTLRIRTTGEASSLTAIKPYYGECKYSEKPRHCEHNEVVRGNLMLTGNRWVVVSYKQTREKNSQ